MENQNDTVKITEEQLEAVTGGGRTQNRYNPIECRGLAGPLMLCKTGPGIFDSYVWCDHYRESEVKSRVESGYKREYKTISCAQNGFPEQEHYV